MHLETGDIILTSKKSVIARFMDWFQKDPVFWGHVLIVKDENIAWEAYWWLREVPIKVYTSKEHYKILRKKDLTEEQKEIMRSEAPKLLGNFYSIDRIFLQLLDHIFHTKRFSASNRNEECQVCSSYVAWIYDKACGYKFNEINWESCDPDDIDDDTIEFPDRWIILNEKGARLRFLKNK